MVRDCFGSRPSPPLRKGNVTTFKVCGFLHRLQCRQDIILAVPFYCGVVAPAFQAGVGKFRRAKDQSDHSTALARPCGMFAADAESKMNIRMLRRTVQIWQLATRNNLAAKNETNLYPRLPSVTRCQTRSTSEIDYHLGVPNLCTTYVNRPDQELKHVSSSVTTPDSDYFD